ncbi:MAG TPA: CUAEP/CCAEP-tail radical SAM protein [Ktedonobacteraceae bacterium]
MRLSGEILLISCYELGHQPLHLATLQSLLNRAGYLPLPVDTALETLNDEAIAGARFVALSVPMHTALRLGEQVARRIRERNPQAFICLYGLYALLNADYLLQNTIIDAALGGEYEEPLLALINALERGDAQPSTPGVKTRWRESGPWMQRAPVVLPDRARLPTLARYAHLEMDGEAVLAGYSETTRGCKHTCRHCPITPVYHGRFFAFPAEIVLSDIRAQVAQGARHITFGDPDFFNGPTHAMRIVRALHQEFPTLTFDATIKIEHLLMHQRLLPELRELGCAFVVSAVESLNGDVLMHLAKDHSRDDVVRAFALMAEAGIPLRPSLLPFSPWETLESYLDLLTFFEEHHLIEHVDPVHFSIRLLLPPGSSLLETPEEKPWLGELDAAAYTYRWRHPDPRMDSLQREIAALVEQAQVSRQQPVVTFFQIKALALQACGRLANTARARKRYGQGKVLPHLSESWFC